MTQLQEVDQFAARLRALKGRANASFEALAKETGISSSSLHRYCAGTKLPVAYGPVHAIAEACGATNEELREIHRLWVLANSARTSSGGPPAGSDKEATRPSQQPAALPSRLRNNRRAISLTVASLLAAATAATVALSMPDDSPESSTGSKSSSQTSQAVSIHVFNTEGNCRDRKDHVPACSMGLARNPRLKYDADNVVAHRIWHNDVLVADCVLYDGDRVEDETGIGTTRWFRVRLNDVPGGHAWLPAVRTHDSPALPRCE